MSDECLPEARRCRREEQERIPTPFPSSRILRAATDGPATLNNNLTNPRSAQRGPTIGGLSSVREPSVREGKRKRFFKAVRELPKITLDKLRGRKRAETEGTEETSRARVLRRNARSTTSLFARSQATTSRVSLRLRPSEPSLRTSPTSGGGPSRLSKLQESALEEGESAGKSSTNRPHGKSPLRREPINAESQKPKDGKGKGKSEPRRRTSVRSERSESRSRVEMEVSYRLLSTYQRNRYGSWYTEDL